MDVLTLEELVQEAINDKRVIEVDYIRKEDGVSTCRLMEPYDVKPHAKSKTGKLMLWAWCLQHDRIEQKYPENITGLRIMGQSFVPRTFNGPVSYRLPRNW